MNYRINFLFVIVVLLASGFSCTSSSSSRLYTPPDKNDLGNNEYEYISSPLYEGTEAGDCNPKPDSSPEAAVVKFLASQARGDDAWKSALIPEADRNDRLTRKLNSWGEWKITKWQLRKLQLEETRAYITVYFEISYEGGLDDVEDEFELRLKDGVWLIVYPPT